ncbi:MAG TPA: hypothetical protein VFA63_16660 [Pseudonocardiaceae bacterium]|nr:hypothetical protein [Pseudonocardiaceae bacterium]
MNFHWTQSKKYLLIIATSAAALDGALTTLVVHQHNQNTLTGPANVPTAAARIPALLPPQPTPTPHKATPALATSAPPIITPPQPPPATHKRLKPPTVLPRRVNPPPAPLPLPPPPPTTPTKSAPAVKPGTPPELS